MSRNIAIAGGNGALGKTFLDAFRNDASDRYQTFVLTRRKRNFEDSRELEVMYRNVDSLRKVLEEHKIHMVICTFDMSPRCLSVSQMNLIRAAELSRCTMRFIPTSYGVAYPRSAVGRLPGLREHFACLDALAETQLEWTVVVNGLFLDYYGMPYIETKLERNVVVVDMQARKAAIPGSGEALVSFAYSGDVARLVVRAMDLGKGKWEREMKVVGSSMTWKEFVALAEEVTESKFEVVHDSVEKLKGFEVTELPGHRDLYKAYPKERLQTFLSVYEMWTTDETSLVRRRGSLNEMFPDVDALTVREVLERYVSGTKETMRSAVR